MRPTTFSSKLQRKRRIRAKVQGTADRPRLSVYVSLRQILVQLIDDAKGHTLIAASTRECKAKPDRSGATKLGGLVAEKAKKVKIGTIVFDRSGYKYHGRVKAIAEAAREGGLKF